MTVEIGEPYEREVKAEREELPPVAGCGWVDPNYDPMAAWKAREAAKPAAQERPLSVMPCVEAMPNWRQFVGWIEPVTDASVQPEIAPQEPSERTEQAEAKAPAERPIEVGASTPQTESLSPPLEPLPESAMELSLPSFEEEDELVLDLGDLDLGAPERADDQTVQVASVGADQHHSATLSVSAVGLIDAVSPQATERPVEDHAAESVELEPSIRLDGSRDEELEVVTEESPERTMMVHLDDVSLDADETLEVGLGRSPETAASLGAVNRPGREDGFAAEDAEQRAGTLAAAPADATMVVHLDEDASSSDEPTHRPKDVLNELGRGQRAALAADRSERSAKGELPVKLATVRPLAHPGRLPRRFELSEAEKVVLRLCNGQRTTKAILNEDIALDASALTVFLKRCAQVKLVTFKR
jgi:hypothetical protein